MVYRLPIYGHFSLIVCHLLVLSPPRLLSMVRDLLGLGEEARRSSTVLEYAALPGECHDFCERPCAGETAGGRHLVLTPFLLRLFVSPVSGVLPSRREPEATRTRLPSLP